MFSERLIGKHEPGEKKAWFIHSSITTLLALFPALLFSRTLWTSPPFLTPLSNVPDAPKPPAEDRFIMPDEFGTPAPPEPERAKRSPIDSNRVGGLNVETLVVADRKMLEKHGRDNVTTYVLTVMNMVRTMFSLSQISQRYVICSSDLRTLFCLIRDAFFLTEATYTPERLIVPKMWYIVPQTFAYWEWLRG